MSQYVTEDYLDRALNGTLDGFSAKMFRYLDTRFGEVAARIDGLKQNFSNLQSDVDALSKQVEIYHDEMIARDARVDRHEVWIGQLADKAKLKLGY